MALRDEVLPSTVNGAGKDSANGRHNIEQKLEFSFRGVAQLARAAVSKTAGRGFESCHPCQAEVVE